MSVNSYPSDGYKIQEVWIKPIKKYRILDFLILFLLNLRFRREERELKRKEFIFHERIKEWT